MNKNYFAVIMAGGVGSRFWPVSTPDNPKQFHDMLGTGRSLIQHTFDRLLKLIPEENIMIATNERYKELVLQHLPQLDEQQLLLEPAMRNTAPCILYSALKIADKNEDAVMIVAPSDHFIENETEFIANVETAFKACSSQDILMTLGIKPAGPNTGYGYIKYDETDNEICKVEAFVEKPDLAKAQGFLRQGGYLWNAGIFIWSVKAIIRSFQDHLPQLFELMCKGNEFWNSKEETKFIQDHYSLSENISIDYGVMEKAENVYVMATDFGWNDLGTWGSLYDKLSKDESKNAIVNGLALLSNSSGNIIRTQAGKKVVIQGLSDFIVVETEDTIMIVPKNAEQDIKEISKAAEQQLNR